MADGAAGESSDQKTAKAGDNCALYVYDERSGRTGGLLLATAATCSIAIAATTWTEAQRSAAVSRTRRTAGMQALLHDTIAEQPVFVVAARPLMRIAEVARCKRVPGCRTRAVRKSVHDVYTTY